MPLYLTGFQFYDLFLETGTHVDDLANVSSI